MIHTYLRRCMYGKDKLERKKEFDHARGFL